MKQARLLQILLSPHNSEKANEAAEKRKQFVFRVVTDAQKPEIKQAVEWLFKVKVQHVQVVNVKGKRKQFGRLRGKRADWKKAYVCLQEGYDINFGIENF
ncbi:MAG: 50S ribosomal protein L23 [Beggiatoa sp. IS2]|nr:MAG: 50S ribosomal protein L23 [Beggiatoa sp. IS2]